jgi:hypothetical protein
MACSNIIDNTIDTVRRGCRNVKRWRLASMALLWTAAATLEAAKGLRRLKAHKQSTSSASHYRRTAREGGRRSNHCCREQSRVAADPGASTAKV